MIKSILLAILTALAVLFFGEFASYWMLMIAIFLLALLLNPRPWAAFLAAGLALGISWFALMIWISAQSGSDLPNQMAVLMGIKSDNLLWLITGVLGFLIGGFSAMTGALFRILFERKETGIYKS